MHEKGGLRVQKPILGIQKYHNIEMHTMKGNFQQEDTFYMRKYGPENMTVVLHQHEIMQINYIVRGDCRHFINDSTYGSSCDGKNVYQSLVRSCGYAAHPMKDRQHVPDDRYVPCFDQHEVRYRFALQGGDAADRMAAVTNEAILFHERPEVMASFHGKCAASRESAWEVENPSIVLTAVQRQAENGKLHIRLFNPLDVPQKTAVRVGALRGEAAFGPYEFKTLEIYDEEQTIRETSVL